MSVILDIRTDLFLAGEYPATIDRLVVVVIDGHLQLLTVYY